MKIWFLLIGGKVWIFTFIICATKWICVGISSSLDDLHLVASVPPALISSSLASICFSLNPHTGGVKTWPSSLKGRSQTWQGLRNCHSGQRSCDIQTDLVLWRWWPCPLEVVILSQGGGDLVLWRWWFCPKEVVILSFGCGDLVHWRWWSCPLEVLIFSF